MPMISITNRLSALILLAIVIPMTGHATGNVETPAMFSGIQLNRQQPIDVESDSLKVLQLDQKAVFTGNVIATQDTLRLSGAEMTVFYGDVPAKNATSDSKDYDITRLEVTGKVVITLPDRTATAERGVYDVTSGKMELFDNVVLTKEGSTVRGVYFVHDLQKDISTISSGKSGSTPAGSSRVKAVFVPKERP